MTIKEGHMAKQQKKNSLEKRLKIYSAAAAGVLALAPSAEAAIHYSGPQNLTVDSSNPRIIDLDGNGTNDFRFDHYYTVKTDQGTFYYGSIYIAPEAGGQGHIAGTMHNDPVRLPDNYLIGPNLINVYYYWDNPNYNTLNGTYFGSTSTMGSFNNSRGYIGVRFHTDACQGTDYAYGWFQYEGNTGSTPGDYSGTIIDWAYEGVCNRPIAAGQKQSTAIPTINEWGAIVFTLLLGGIAARNLRKEKKDQS